jgi:hypothetical protein
MDLLRKIKTLYSLKDETATKTHNPIHQTYLMRLSPLECPNTLLKRHQSLFELKKSASREFPNEAITNHEDQIKEVDKLEELVQIMLDDFDWKPVQGR